jgi:hypothetical protein
MGAFLEALAMLGDQLEYGQNAFFVRSDPTADKFQAPFSAENHYNRAKYLLHYWPGHPADWGRYVEVPIEPEVEPWLERARHSRETVSASTKQTGEGHLYKLNETRYRAGSV